MALQPRIIACGNKRATFAMAVRFLTGPAVMAAASIAVGLRGKLLHVAIVQVQITHDQPSTHRPLHTDKNRLSKIRMATWIGQVAGRAGTPAGRKS